MIKHDGKNISLKRNCQADNVFLFELASFSAVPIINVINTKAIQCCLLWVGRRYPFHQFPDAAKRKEQKRKALKKESS